jgi:hypothetical protein
MSPSRTEQAIDAAEQAAEAVRTLNHLTRSPDPSAHPADTYLLIAALATLAQRLPQLLDQITDRLNQDLHPAQLRVDDWAPVREPAALLVGVASSLRAAGHLAHRLSVDLDTAQQAMAHLSVRDNNRADAEPELPEMTRTGGQFSTAARGSVFSRC